MKTTLRFSEKHRTNIKKPPMYLLVSQSFFQFRIRENKPTIPPCPKTGKTGKAFLKKLSFRSFKSQGKNTIFLEITDVQFVYTKKILYLCP